MKKLTPEFLQHLQRLLSDPEWPPGFDCAGQILLREAALLMLMTGVPHYVWFNRAPSISSATAFVNIAMSEDFYGGSITYETDP